jgi:hypothetical protein
VLHCALFPPLTRLPSLLCATHTPVISMQAVQTHTAPFLLGLTALIALLILLPFCRYHLYIVAIGQTTFERIRKKYVSAPNPHDHGFCKNYINLCFSETAPSLVRDLHENLSLEAYLAENVDRQRFSVFYSRYGSVGADPINPHPYPNNPYPNNPYPYIADTGDTGDSGEQDMDMGMVDVGDVEGTDNI